MAEGADASSTQATDPRVRRALTMSFVDGSFHAIMVGVSESYLGPLAVELDHDDAELALLATVPLFAGALAQLAAGPLTAIVQSRKKLVVLGASCQAATHLAFIAIAWFGVRGFWPLLLAQTLFWVSGLVIAPAWGSWMADVTAGAHRERYFAIRSGLLQTILLVAFVVAGVVLQDAHTRHAALPAFAALHAVGLVARGLSASALAMKPEIRQAPRRSALQAITRFRDAFTSSRRETAIYLAALMFGAHIAVPFFTPYMLRELRLDYVEYATLTSLAILGKAISFPLYHHVANRFGMKTVLGFAGLSIAIVPMLWSVITSFEGLLFAQLLSGVAWSGLEFTSFQLLLRSAKPDLDVEFLSLSNAASGLAQLAGALVGGLLLERAHLNYLSVFLVSGVCRALPLVLLGTVVSRLDLRNLPRLFVRILSVRPAGGVRSRPVLGTADRGVSPSPTSLHSRHEER